jgi:hypothetical protein
MRTSKQMGVLRSRTCSCGRSKRKLRSFCRKCYLRLPLKLRKNLYTRTSEAYDIAFQHAQQYLEKQTKVAS